MGIDNEPITVTGKTRNRTAGRDNVATSNAAGVVWITGYSASGKTTVGRKLEARLRSEGLQTVFLDGDDLRSIFAGRWGYERAERVELGKVYFRLCSHLAAQGVTVIIAAVAMYEELWAWVDQNIPRALTVFLNVPEEERRRRDALTKGLYENVGDLSRLYDDPQAVDLQIDNYGDTKPDEVAAEISRVFRLHSSREADLGRNEHWGDYYSQQRVPDGPSPFARAVAKELPESAIRVLDVGCGNGRDTAFFAELGHNVTGIDASEAAVELCKRVHGDLSIPFLVGSLPALIDHFDGAQDAVYSRFVIHAMPVHEEIALLDAAYELLKPGGRLFIECRSIKDPLANEGEVISPTERIHGHYRRFIVLDELRKRLKSAGFTIISEVESRGLAVFGTDDPVVIRVTAQRGMAEIDREG